MVVTAPAEYDAVVESAAVGGDDEEGRAGDGRIMLQSCFLLLLVNKQLYRSSRLQ